MPEVVLHPHAPFDDRQHRDIEDFAPAFADRLRAVHRHVGVAQHLAAVPIPAGGHDEADTDGHKEVAIPDGEWFAHGSHQQITHLLRLGPPPHPPPAHRALAPPRPPPCVSAAAPLIGCPPPMLQPPCDPHAHLTPAATTHA